VEKPKFPENHKIIDLQLTDNVSINQIPNIYPAEAFQYLGLDEIPAERAFYRNIERLGINLNSS
jgi:hypothetical protein